MGRKGGCRAVPVTRMGLELWAGEVVLAPTWQARSPSAGGSSGRRETVQTVPPSSWEVP